MNLSPQARLDERYVLSCSHHRFIESGDRAMLKRIQDYNKDDCIATAVLVDGIRALR